MAVVNEDASKMLIEHARDGELEAVKNLLTYPGVDVNYADPRDGTTALMGAALRGHLDIVQELLALGANVNQIAHGNFTALWAAAYKNNPDIVQVLLAAGANPNVETLNARQTPLDVAVTMNYLEVIKLLVSAGADVNRAVGRYGLSVLAQSILKPNKDLFDFLLKVHGIDVNQPIRNGATPLMLAVLYGTTDYVAGLLAAGADINAPNNRDLILAQSVLNNPVMIHLLLSYGASLPDPIPPQIQAVMNQVRGQRLMAESVARQHVLPANMTQGALLPFIGPRRRMRTTRRVRKDRTTRKRR